MRALEPMERTPAQLEDDIATTRESLFRKVDAIQERLDPRTYIRRATDRVRHPPATAIALAALGAIATGAWLAATGWQRNRAAIAARASRPPRIHGV